MSEALQTAFQSDYGQLEPSEITLLQDGQAGNKTYLAAGAQGRTILKVYGDYWRDKGGWIQNELELLLFLAGRDIPVATPLLRLDGRLYGTTETPEGSRPYAAFTFAEGTMEWPLGETKSRSLGAALARLHLAADDFHGEHDWREYDITRLVDRPLARMLPYIADHPKAIAALQHLAAQIKDHLSRIPNGRSEYGVIHGDIHQGNVHFRHDGTLTFFDFSLCGAGWRAYDFAGFLWPMRDETIRDPAMRLSCDSFLAGYGSVRELTPGEAAAIPAFVKVRDLWETGDWLECGQNLDPAVVSQGILGLVQRFEAAPLEAS